jgi:hypothetical protein
MNKRNTTASYFNHPNFEEPIPLNYNDPIHCELANLCFEGKAPEFTILIGPQIELPR